MIAVRVELWTADRRHAKALYDVVIKPSATGGYAASMDNMEGDALYTTAADFDCDRGASAWVLVAKAMAALGVGHTSRDSRLLAQVAALAATWSESVDLHTRNCAVALRGVLKGEAVNAM